jgi:hypothetical protein
MFDMHRKWTIVLVAIMTISLSLLWQKPGIATQPQGSFSVSGEAKQLAAIEKDYFNKRVNNDWKGIYQYQNPRFKEKVSAEELEFFEGRVVINYRSDGHISGGLLPSKEYIKANPRRHDALGFPRTMQYKWYFSSHINVKDYILESIALSKDGKYAKVSITLTGKEVLPKHLFRHEYKMDFERPWVDYWEKVNGQWKVALLKRKSSISGVKVHYFVPNEIAEWDKKDFIQISAEKLALNQKP